MTTDLVESSAYVRALCEQSYVYVHLEPTNACNANCMVCPREEMTRSVGMMTWETFCRVMDVVLPTPIPMLALVGFGEPTLHRRLTAMVEYVRARRGEMVIKVT